MLSMTGCFFLRRSTASTSFDYEELRKTVTEDLTNEISVTDWNGNVPDGMEVKYVVVKEVYRNDRSRDTELYDYDKAGRVIYYKSDSSTDRSKRAVPHLPALTIQLNMNITIKSSWSHFRILPMAISHTNLNMKTVIWSIRIYTAERIIPIARNLNIMTTA